MYKDSSDCANTQSAEPAQSAPVIVCAAIRQKNTGLVVCGPRHFDATMWSQILGIPFAQFTALQRTHELPPPDERHKAWVGAEDGFIDQYGEFYTREEAWLLVTTNGQRLRRPEPFVKGQLYSENLY